MNYDSKLLTDKEAAEYLTLSVSTLRAWRLKGVGPSYRKLEGAVRYNILDLNDFVDNNLINLNKKTQGALDE